MALYHDMQQLIGNTPLVKLNHIDLPDGANLYAKLELYNPSGSVKDRIGKYMIEDAEKRGILKKGGTIVEATAGNTGNTGLGIAFAALNKGYKIVFVVPTKFSEEKQTLLRALGAEIINTPREGGMLGAWDKAEEIRRSIPGAVTLEQFKNQANPQAHYETTGREIYEDLNGNIDYLVAGAGSGGTYSGVVRFLKEKNKNITGVLADPVGSTMGGGVVDRVVKMTDAEAFDGARELASREGIFAGSSSGAALAAAKKLVNGGARGNIVIILPDRGDRYFTKHLYE